MLRRLCGIASIMVGLALCPGDARAEWATIFRDDCDGSTLDTTSWNLKDANGNLEVSGGRLQLRSMSNGFPTIVSNSGIVPATGVFRVRFGFQFGTATCLGTRLGVQAESETAPG